MRKQVMYCDLCGKQIAECNIPLSGLINLDTYELQRKEKTHKAYEVCFECGSKIKNYMLSLKKEVPFDIYAEM